MMYDTCKLIVLQNVISHEYNGKCDYTCRSYVNNLSK